MQETDFLIIGQGIAGTLLAHFLMKEGQKVLVLDNHHKTASSKVAAGIINPVTGRRYVKSWRIDTLLPAAEEVYRELENQLDISFFHQNNIVRALFSDKEEHNWHIRKMEPGYQKYLDNKEDAIEFEGKINPVYAFGEIAKSAQVDMPVLVEAYRNYLIESDIFILEEFDYKEVREEENFVMYKNIKTKKVIFCEGSAAINNPFFNYLPFNLAKGEVFILHIPDANFRKMLKYKNFLAPLGNDRYWFGSSYNWDFENDFPTEKEKKKLIEILEKTIKVPFTIEQHLAAIRPTVKDRRPFLGVHPQYRNLFIFNGLGTKGASLAPYFAEHLVNFLVEGKDIEKEVNIERFL